MLQTFDHKPLKLAKFHPVLKLSNFEPDWLSFTFTSKFMKIMKKQGGR